MLTVKCGERSTWFQAICLQRRRNAFTGERRGTKTMETEGKGRKKGARNGEGTGNLRQGRKMRISPQKARRGEKVSSGGKATEKRKYGALNNNKKGS